MYKALNYWVFGGYTGEKTPYEFIDWASQKEAIDGIELTGGDSFSLEISREECEKIRAYAAEKGVGLRTIVSDGAWKYFLGAADETERREAVEVMKKYLHIASWLGAESVLIVPGATKVPWDATRPLVPYQTVWDQATKSIRELIPTAEACKVNIAVENVWNQFLLSPVEWKYFLDQFDSEYTGMYFDVANCCLYGRPYDYPAILGKRIKAVHLKNFTGTDCAGGLHGFGDDLFEGDVDFKKVFAEFEKIGYTGPYTVEMVPFCRQPNMVLPDLALSEKMAEQMKEL